jgi:hypothetical protein
MIAQAAAKEFEQPRRRIPGRMQTGSSIVPASPSLSLLSEMKMAHSIPFLTGREVPKMDSSSLNNKWRRRESNPRPEIAPRPLLRV